MNDEKDQADANATNFDRPPADSDLAPPGQKEHKKHKKKKHKHEGNKGVDSAEDISSPASPELSIPTTHPQGPTSAISNGAALPPEVEPTSAAVPTAPFSVGTSPEVQCQNIQEPAAAAHREIVERNTSKCDAAPAIPVSVAAPYDKFPSRHDEDQMDIGAVLLVAALVTFIVWLIFLQLQEQHPSERHAKNETETTHE
ncbi:uncharacterized protein LOC135399548 [Ornithodoros turicata]|uniref:uncharacterized protein LOC135399548 n=1 Tax=Ornithodoros turicata TaxID=34597 RepID=UPI003138A6C2